MTTWGVTKRALFLGLAPASVIAAILAFYFTTTRFGELEQALAERGRAIARHLATGAEYGAFSGNQPVLQNLARSAVTEPDVTTITISVVEGKMLAQSGASSAVTGAEAAHDVMPFTAPILRTQTVLEDFYEVAPHSELPLGFVTVEISRASLDAKKNRLLLDTLLITALGLFITWVMAVRMSRGITHPILRLADTVERLGAGELAVRANAESAGAVGVLQKGVNKMAEALQSMQTGLEQRISEATAQLTEKRAEADRANLAKSRFLAAASHDLRQPVHALGLFIAELQSKNLCAEDTKIVEQIEAGVLALSDLLDSMLDVSRLDAGALPAHVIDFSVHGLLRRMEAEFGPSAREKGLRFSIVTCRAIVRSDPVLLERILLNLVANAVRYTNRGRIIVGCRRRPGLLSLQVRDTGPGIPESRREYIFQEFYQLGNPERDRRKGLGLGLAIVERLGRLLDHKIGLISKPGKGSLFSVDVPFGDRCLAQVAADAPLQTKGLEGALLAIVDDDDLVRTSMEGLARQWGCQAVSAASGRGLLDALAGRTPDVIVCDYRLPMGENGIEVIARVRVACAKEVPAILISGDTAPKLVRTAESAGYPLLHKPVRPARLRALLTHLLAARER